MRAAKGAISGCTSSQLIEPWTKPRLIWSTTATDSMPPAAPRPWPTSDFVELIHGNVSGVRPRARCQVPTSSGSAIVAVRWPLIASTRAGSTPPMASAASTQRRAPSGFGAVMLPPPRWPPQFTWPPRISA